MTHSLFKSNPAEARWAYCIEHGVVCIPPPTPPLLVLFGGGS